MRKTIVEFLESKGLFRGTRPNPMVLGLCSRSGDVIEPLMRPQWCAVLWSMAVLATLHYLAVQQPDCHAIAAQSLSLDIPCAHSGEDASHLQHNRVQRGAVVHNL